MSRKQALNKKNTAESLFENVESNPKAKEKVPQQSAPSKTAAHRKGEKGATSTKDRKSILYAEARKEADSIVKQTTTSLEEIKAKLEALRSLEVGFEKQVAAYEPLLEVQESAYEALTSLHPVMVEDLGSRRAERLNSASKMHQANHSKRAASSKRVSRDARRQLEESKRKANDATDATDLIKSLKALLRF